MTEKVIIAGFGGQGILSIGKMLAYAGMIEEKHVSWLPSYGPEMRGGTANCNVIISDHMIASPIVDEATALIALNKPSLDKFEEKVLSNKLILINSSLTPKKNMINKNIYYIPANDIAHNIGNIKIANMVMLGAYLELTKVVKYDTVIKALKKLLGESKNIFFDMDIVGLQKGAKCIT
jgi:2-oxoglutarate ferredoxin oxidoreductase subunit gamma